MEIVKEQSISSPEPGAPAMARAEAVVSSPDKADAGFTGIWRYVIGTGVISTFLLIYILDRRDNQNNLKDSIKAATEQREKDRQDDRERHNEDRQRDAELRKSQADLADRAHKQFLESSSRAWEEVRKNTEATRVLGDEVKRGNDAVQTKLNTLIEETRKSKMPESKPNGGQ